MERKTLNADDWIRLGMRLLSQRGAKALRAEALAREMKTTKGSFYWHFKDMADFERQILATWQHLGTQDIIARMGQGGLSGAAKLHQLFALIGEANAKNPYGGVRAEPGIREWAKSNAMVRRCVEDTGRQRMAYVASLFEDCGKKPDIAARNARILYAALIGYQALAVQGPVDVGAEMQALVAILLK